MRDLTEDFLELIRRTSTDLPADVERALRAARQEKAQGSPPRSASTPSWRTLRWRGASVAHLPGHRHTDLLPCATRRVEHAPAAGADSRAVAEATARAYLRPNAVDSLSGKNSGNNLGDEAFPTIHFEERRANADGRPDAQGRRVRERRRAVLAAPRRVAAPGANWKACAGRPSTPCTRPRARGAHPGVLGIAIGGDRGSSFLASKEALLRPLDDRQPRCGAGGAGGTPDWAKPTNWASARWGSAARRPCWASSRAPCTGCRPASSSQSPTCAGHTAGG